MSKSKIQLPSSKQIQYLYFPPMTRTIYSTYRPNINTPKFRVKNKTEQNRNKERTQKDEKKQEIDHICRKSIE